MRASLGCFLAALLLVSGVAAAADGGLDASADADTDASMDASTDATPSDAANDAATDATPPDAGPIDDSGPITYRPDTGTVTDDAGTDGGATGGCSCHTAASDLGGASPACIFGAIGIALVAARRRRRTR